MNTRTGYWTSFRFGIAMLALALWFAVGAFAPVVRAATTEAGDAEDQGLVDCMLPGQIKRLNNQTMIMGARRPIRTTRADCHVRGGEFHEPDRVAEADRTADAERIAEADRAAAAEHAAKAHRTARYHHKAKTHRKARPHPTSTTAESAPTK